MTGSLDHITVAPSHATMVLSFVQIESAAPTTSELSAYKLQVQKQSLFDVVLKYIGTLVGRKRDQDYTLLWACNNCLICCIRPLM
jgi:hypothetical protein